MKTLTEFTVWLAFTVTLLASIELVLATVYALTISPSWNDLLLLIASIVCLGLHYSIRWMPTSSKQK